MCLERLFPRVYGNFIDLVCFSCLVTQVCVSNLTSDLGESHNGISCVHLVVVLFPWKKIPTNKLQTKQMKVVLCSNAQLALP